jgi:hypothetical protein
MSLFGIFLASQLVVTVGNQPPAFDVKPTCRAYMGDVVQTQQSCENDESTARQQLAKEWNQFVGSDKAMCTDLTKGFDPSYVELLSCLEMMRDAKLPSDTQK